MEQPMNWADVQNKIALVDGDEILHKVCLANDNQGMDFETLCLSMSNMLKDLLSFLGANYYILFIGDGKDHRYTVYDQYKANRESRIDQILKEELIQYAIYKLGAYYVEGESDDWIAMVHNELVNTEHTPIIVSQDKDFNQVCGWRYDTYHNREKPIRYNNITRAHAWLMKQWLMGDASDNIPGLPGIGKKKAEEITVQIINSLPDANSKKTPLSNPQALAMVVSWYFAKFMKGSSESIVDSLKKAYQNLALISLKTELPKHVEIGVCQFNGVNFILSEENRRIYYEQQESQISSAITKQNLFP